MRNTYGELGINLTTAINALLRQFLCVGGFSFEVRLEQPNQETITTMMEAERIAHDPNVKHYQRRTKTMYCLVTGKDTGSVIFFRIGC